MAKRETTTLCSRKMGRLLGGLMLGAGVLLIVTLRRPEPDSDTDARSQGHPELAQEGVTGKAEELDAGRRSSKSPLIPPVQSPAVGDVWSRPKPPLTNYSAFAQMVYSMKLNERLGRTNQRSDVQVAYNFPICVNPDGTTNRERLQVFRSYMDRAVEFDRTNNGAVEPTSSENPISQASALQRKIMREEGRTLPPRDFGWQISPRLEALVGSTFLDANYSSFAHRILFTIAGAQAEYLVDENPGRARCGRSAD